MLNLIHSKDFLFFFLSEDGAEKRLIKKNLDMSCDELNSSFYQLKSVTCKTYEQCVEMAWLPNPVPRGNLPVSICELL